MGLPHLRSCLNFYRYNASLSLHLRSDCHIRQNSLAALVLHAHVTSKVPTIQFLKKHYGIQTTDLSVV